LTLAGAWLETGRQGALRDLLKFGFTPARDDKAYHHGDGRNGGERKRCRLRNMLQGMTEIIGGAAIEYRPS
jgi:hypothetical protein